MAIYLSHGGTTIYSSVAPSRELCVGTVDGVVFLERESPTGAWRVSNQSLRGRHVIALAIEPVSETVFATMHNGGVAASEDFGKTWEFRNRGLLSENVYCVTAVRENGGVKLFTGTEPAHLFVSDDLGRHWDEVASLRSVPSVSKWTFPAPPHDAHVKNVTADPHDPAVLYVCVEQGGLFKSENGGRSWRELQGFNDDCHRLIVLGSDSRKLYLPTGYGFYRSADGGETWENVSPRVSRIGYPDPLVFNPLRESLMFLAGAEADPFHWMQSRSANPRIARTRDGGETWEMLGHGMPERLDANFEAVILEAWEGGCEVYAANTDGEVYCTNDEGDHWTKIIQGLPAVSKTIHYTILRSDLAFDKKQQA